LSLAHAGDDAREDGLNLDELDQIIDRSTRAPLSESEGQKLKNRAPCHGIQPAIAVIVHPKTCLFTADSFLTTNPSSTVPILPS